jgi:acyl-CoA synthetase (AMP-forming)/AMP-acid ligase II
LTYRPQVYAGLQVILQALANGGTGVVPEPNLGASGVVALMKSAGVGYASATPSYWRRLLLGVDSAELASVPLCQITIGGEAVDQPLLDRLRDTFPHARIIHIYASTEMGRCFSVADGKSGFPREYLDREMPGGIWLRVIDGQLYVKSSNSMRGYDPLSGDSASSYDADGWFATGDLVRVDADRVYFLGRDSDLINVGGNKVNPFVVEQALRELPEVADVRVFAQKSSITGQIVACQIVPAAGLPDDVVRKAVLTAGAERLDRFHQPRLLTIVDRIELSSSDKVKRT